MPDDPMPIGRRRVDDLQSFGYARVERLALFASGVLQADRGVANELALPVVVKPRGGVIACEPMLVQAKRRKIVAIIAAANATRLLRQHGSPQRGRRMRRCRLV